MKVYNYEIVFREIPEEVTLALSISGCPNKCIGCHSPWLREDIGNELNEEYLLKIIDKYKDEITCIAFMGGDNDPLYIEQMARVINKYNMSQISHIKVAWYSGNNNYPEIDLSQFDYIKTGSYKQEFGPLDQPTTNQKLWHIIRYFNTNGAFYWYNIKDIIDITSKFWKS